MTTFGIHRNIFVRVILVTLSLLTLLSAGTPHVFGQGQDSLTLTVTPPFFELSINPGETWSSFIKVVNVNDYDMTLYASVVNFSANEKENGQGKFTPIFKRDPEAQGSMLGEWITVTKDPIYVPAGGSMQVPFSIKAPPNADPGGHYAAILIGTQPTAPVEGGLAVSSYISSLIFAKVSGTIIEQGDIRELSTPHTFFNAPEIPITLRFENTGNVHVLPQGNITIYNMWGKVRGTIPVNQNTAFGNVLPGTTRKFSYTWTGESNPFEAGKYTAVATLSYGSDGRKNVSSITTFWIVPIVPVAAGLGLTLLFVGIIVLFVRAYIRRALNLESERIGVASPQKRKTQMLTMPIREGVMDLRNVSLTSSRAPDTRLSLLEFFKRHKFGLVFIIVVIFAAFFLRTYLHQVLVPERVYDVHTEEEIPLGQQP